MMQAERRDVLPPGTRIDAFSIEGTIGTGGFGITYAALDLNLRRKVAIKEYCPLGFAGRAEDGISLAPLSEGSREAYESGRRRFLDEAQTLAQFQDPHIVRVMRFLEANGTAYLIMEFEDGELLSQRVSARGRLSESEVLPIATRLLGGLSVVHAKRYLHRDIKPANVMIRGDGHPVLLDFGAARLALESTNRSMTVMLTPGYAPFEQYTTGQPLGPWSDIYAVGATLYKCLTGRVPAPSTDRWSMTEEGKDPVLQALTDPSLGLSECFHQALVWMMRPRAPDRPQSVDEVLELLRDCAPTGAPSSREPATLPHAPEPPTRVGAPAEYERFTRPEQDPPAPVPAGGRRRLVATVAAVGVVLAATGGWFALTRTSDATAPDDPPRIAAPIEQAALSPAPALEPGGVFRDPLRSGGQGPEMVVLPAGSFTIGSAPDESGRDADEGPAREVRITRPLALGRFEVSVAQFERFAEATGFITTAEREPSLGCRVHDGEWRSLGGRTWRDPGYPQTASHPVVCVSWDDASAYTRWLSSETGESYGLPSEAGWEYAARASTTGARFWSSNDEACTYSNVSDLSRARMHGLSTAADNVFQCADGHAYASPVGSFEPNRFGLHDVLGNVWEWTADCWAPDYAALPPDGDAFVSAECEAIVFRGGSWINPPRFTRSASRAADPRDYRYYNVGFRVARRLAGES